MIPRAIRSPVYGMARPRLPGSERVAVRAAAAQLPDDLSAIRKAARVARQVVRAYLRDEGCTDPFQRALIQAKQSLDPDPAIAIATSPQTDIADKFLSHRLARYEARGGRQLGAEAWEAETRTIAQEVEKQLTRRYRDYLR